MNDEGIIELMLALKESYYITSVHRQKLIPRFESEDRGF